MPKNTKKLDEGEENPTADMSKNAVDGENGALDAEKSVIDPMKISRSIAACKRCRKKKIKCSHHFPRCTACWKAGTECISLDPATGREIPRSYIVHLESRVEELESQIKNLSSTQQHPPQIAPVATSLPPPIRQHNGTDIFLNQSNIQHNILPNLNTPSSVGISPVTNNNPNVNFNTSDSHFTNTSSISVSGMPSSMNSRNNEPNESYISLQSYQSTNSNGNNFSRPTSFSGKGISFSKLMFAAVHFNNSNEVKDKKPSISNTNASKPPIDPTTSLMSSFSKNIALLPPKQQALDFIALYFAQSNSQLPLFHREEFLNHYFIPIYGEIPANLSFASIHTGIDTSKLVKIKEEDTWYYKYTRLLDSETGANPDMDPFEFSAQVKVPKRFKPALYFVNIVFAIASSIWHLQFPNEISDNFKNAALAHIEDVYSSANRLEALQSMLCLTLYSLMRPCVPGVWYLLGSCLRLCVDLGLHNESSTASLSPFKLDMQRRLFWCCYSLDRQICVYLGRPFGIPEESIKVKFPSLLDDSHIGEDATTNSLYPKNTDLNSMPSYKHISIAMFQIRILQAEIRSILYDNKELPRKFSSMTAWLIDVSLRLDNWRSNKPKSLELMNCNFTVEFFDLNYYHARILLHGLAPARYILTSNDFISLADASKGTILTFYALCNRGALNYTWAVTQNVFMAETSFLYALFHSEDVRNATSLDELKRLTSCSDTVLNNLVDRCDAASQCVEVLSILSRAVVRLKYPNEEDKIFEDSTDKLIPSEDEVKTLQPGGHMNGNMRRLIVSIPELMNEKDTNPNSQKHELDSSETSRKKRQRVENGDIMDDHTDTVVNGFWNVNETELDKFFDQVRKVSSPDSVKSLTLTPAESSESKTNTKGQITSNNVGYSPYSTFSGTGSTPDMQAKHEDANIPMIMQMGTRNNNGSQFHSQYSQFQQYLVPDQQSQQIHSLYGQPSAFTNQPVTPIYHQSSLSPAPPTLMPISSLSPNKNQMVSPNENGSNHSLPENKRRKSKEAQRVYKLMLETGTDSIWDQYFAQPF